MINVNCLNNIASVGLDLFSSDADIHFMNHSLKLKASGNINIQ